VEDVSPEAFADLCGRYELDMMPDTIPELTKRFNVRFPGENIRP
jgi:hypothetical protein